MSKTGKENEKEVEVCNNIESFIDVTIEHLDGLRKLPMRSNSLIQYEIKSLEEKLIKLFIKQYMTKKAQSLKQYNCTSSINYPNTMKYLKIAEINEQDTHASKLKDINILEFLLAHREKELETILFQNISSLSDKDVYRRLTKLLKITKVYLERKRKSSNNNSFDSPKNNECTNNNKSLSYSISTCTKENITNESPYVTDNQNADVNINLTPSQKFCTSTDCSYKDSTNNNAWSNNKYSRLNLLDQYIRDKFSSLRQAPPLYPVGSTALTPSETPTVRRVRRLKKFLTPRVPSPLGHLFEGPPTTDRVKANRHWWWKHGRPQPNVPPDVDDRTSCQVHFENTTNSLPNTQVERFMSKSTDLNFTESKLDSSNSFKMSNSFALGQHSKMPSIDEGNATLADPEPAPQPKMDHCKSPTIGPYAHPILKIQASNSPVQKAGSASGKDMSCSSLEAEPSLPPASPCKALTLPRSEGEYSGHSNEDPKRDVLTVAAVCKALETTPTLYSTYSGEPGFNINLLPNFPSYQSFSQLKSLAPPRHRYVPTVRVNNVCAYCQRPMWIGLKCKICKIRSHAKCAERLTKFCSLERILRNSLLPTMYATHLHEQSQKEEPRAPHSAARLRKSLSSASFSAALIHKSRLLKPDPTQAGVGKPKWNKNLLLARLKLRPATYLSSLRHFGARPPNNNGTSRLKRRSKDDIEIRYEADTLTDPSLYGGTLPRLGPSQGPIIKSSRSSGGGHNLKNLFSGIHSKQNAKGDLGVLKDGHHLTPPSSAHYSSLSVSSTSGGAGSQPSSPAYNNKAPTASTLSITTTSPSYRSKERNQACSSNEPSSTGPIRNRMASIFTYDINGHSSPNMQRLAIDNAESKSSLNTDQGPDRLHFDVLNSSVVTTESYEDSKATETDSPKEYYQWTRTFPYSLKEWNIPYDQIEIGEPIGVGWFAKVFRGSWHGKVAVKILNMEEYLNDIRLYNKYLESFKQEISILRKTRHHNLVLFMGASMKPPNFAIVTSLCKGMSLFKHIHVFGNKFTLNKVIYISTQISQGMGYLHAKGIVHKDLRSKNVFLENGKVVISDFGIFSVAKLCKTNMRRDNYIAIPPGWLYYLAPEIIQSLTVNSSSITALSEIKTLPFTFASDVFSFGTIMYELMVGDWPFVDQPPETLIWQIGSGQLPAFPTSLHPYPRELKCIMLNAFTYDPKERPLFGDILRLLERIPKKRLERSPSHPVRMISKSMESIF